MEPNDIKIDLDIDKSQFKDKKDLRGIIIVSKVD